MQHLNIYTQEDLSQLVRSRLAETKLGEEMHVLPAGSDFAYQLQQSPARFVLLGIPEDIGVRANYGRGGAHTAWKPFLESFLNQQSNDFMDGHPVLLLGHIEVEDLMEASAELNPKSDTDMVRLRQMVQTIDERVTPVLETIIAAGKLPIIIGGGHNNAYPNIRAAAKANKGPVNVINCDPHTDFRPLEGRHSGNGFSYAFQDGFLGRYAACCIHEQYNTRAVLESFKRHAGRLLYTSYEDVFVRNRMDFRGAIQRCIQYVKQGACGVEIDLDAITNVPSSAKTSSGISPVEARQYVYQCGLQLDARYFHIAEGAPVLSHIKADNKTGKLMAYLVSDFIKGTLDKASINPTLTL